VPLLVSLPEHRTGALAARRIETPVSLLDLMPTFAALAGGSPEGAMSGVDLSPSMRGGELPPDRPIVCDHLNVRWGEGSEFRMVRWRNYKLVAFREFGPLFFDLDRDPGEQHDIFESATGDALAVRDRLQAFVAESLDFDSLPARRAASQARLKGEFGLERARALPNQYMLSSGRVIEGDLAIYRQAMITDDPSTFFADWPGEREATT
jgi:choline-sulfatase